MTVDDIIAAAREHLGTPYRHQGRVPGRSLDCAGLLVVVARELGVEHFDVSGYSRRPDGSLLSVIQSQPALERIAAPEPGAVLVMRFASDPQHVALCTGPTLIHSHASVGKVCEHRFADVWRARVIASFRFKGVEQ